VRRVLAPANAASNEREDLWEASVRRDQQRKSQDLDALRYQYHAGQAERLRRTMTELITHHQNAALKLLERKES
jgi:hypothetical protein